MELHDSLGYSTGVNDVVGWVDDEGNEYAIVGLNTGVSIVSVDENPVEEVAFVAGAFNTWRDINTFGHYAYVVSEAEIGLLIIDLQYLPDSVQTYIWQDSLPGPNGPRPFKRAHTLWIDEYGIAYLNGGNLNSGGVVLVDVASNPTDPQFLGYAPGIYSHDVYARDSILYSAEIWAGTVSIYDVHDPQNIILLGRVKTPNEFTHNVWLSDDSRYMFTTDERSNSYVAAYDIQDPANIIEVDRFRQAATAGKGSIPHNVYVWNDWLVVAYYTNGTLIVDAAHPDNLIEVGSFDSWLGVHGGYSGVWGSYPFLPSGRILTSDRASGLYVFIPNYVRGAYLEGTVVDSITQLPIQGATVTIISNEIVLPEITKIDGTFKTGKAIPGVYDILIKKPGYYPKTIEGNFINGELLAPYVELNPLPIFSVSGKVLHEDGSDVPYANVRFSSSDGIFETTADAEGNFSFPAIYGSTYEAQAGVWGSVEQIYVTVDGHENVTLYTRDGYYDDFDLDLGWFIDGQVSEGEWKRGIPTKQLLFDQWRCGASADSPYDIGDNLYSTGLATHDDAGNDEVSDGTTVLVSPPMDVSDFSNPILSFDYWLCEYPPNQYIGFKVWWTNGSDTMLIEEFSNPDTSVAWIHYDIHPEFSGPLDQIRILFTATDTTPGSGDYYLKVHVDNFLLIDDISGVDEESVSKNFHLYPNPVNGSTIWLKPESGIEGQEITLNFFDLYGRKISSFKGLKSDAENGISHALNEGFYFVQWNTDKGESGVEKIFVLKN